MSTCNLVLVPMPALRCVLLLRLLFPGFWKGQQASFN